jgi:hypothetical protein
MEKHGHHFLKLAGKIIRTTVLITFAVLLLGVLLSWDRSILYLCLILSATFSLQGDNVALYHLTIFQRLGMSYTYRVPLNLVNLNFEFQPSIPYQKYS